MSYCLMSWFLNKLTCHKCQLLYHVSDFMIIAIIRMSIIRYNYWLVIPLRLLSQKTEAPKSEIICLIPLIKLAQHKALENPRGDDAVQLLSNMVTTTKCGYWTLQTWLVKLRKKFLNFIYLKNFKLKNWYSV